MLFTIEHSTEYRFTRPVFFEPHQLRFCPRADGSQRLVRFELQIDPMPAGSTQALDVDGNLVTIAWFNDIHERMVIRATSEVETTRDNPYDFLVTPAGGRLPVGYQPREAALLGPYLKRSAVPIHVDPARELAEQLRGASRGEVIPFLSRLTETICHRFKCVHREEGSPWAPATTIEQRQGACRDLAVLWVDICRAVGLAARFVSGYYEGRTTRDKHFLHAWGEVYLPGAGWRGFDPTNGLAISDRHVAVAAAADPTFAAPVDATYRGNDVEAELYADVLVERRSAVELLAC
ncbi:MAG TPA: transglutaminase family protein [Lacipirellulaceae bacterium]|jgi:transglutaminase-like putative cysteine protease|nr:transglutaminase family protein [Lacipirellulaceae bacterium]